MYFFSTREQIDQKWGTPNPVTVRDKELGAIRLRAFGTYSYRIKNPKDVLQEDQRHARELYGAGPRGPAALDVMTSLSAFFGQSGIAFLDMASNQVKFSETLRTRCADVLGLWPGARRLFSSRASRSPKSCKGYFDKAAQMRMVGDLGQYARFQAAESLRPAAANPGGRREQGPGWALESRSARRWLRRWEVGDAGPAGRSDGDAREASWADEERDPQRGRVQRKESRAAEKSPMTASPAPPAAGRPFKSRIASSRSVPIARRCSSAATWMSRPSARWRFSRGFEPTPARDRRALSTEGRFTLLGASAEMERWKLERVVRAF